ncbi:MAG: TatD family hydrolase [Candidatus Eremiobacteraeota bacterium]|nr:TatD family hydrolase [Candidatus Eremiobacteraeota bacterium]
MIDSHVHLDSQPYGDDWQQVLDQAQQVGVHSVVVPATDLDSARRALEMAHQDPRLQVAVGIHPHQAAGYQGQATLESLRELAPGAVAIGETGLECFYDFCPLEQQLESLRGQLGLAAELDLPVILHCREAEEELYRELKRQPCRGVVHCFTGDWEWGQRFLELGLYLGVTGMVTFPKAHNVHEVASKCPLERLLVETDGPYLAPIPYRGKRNSPAYIPLIVEKVAQLRQSTASEIDAASEAATRDLFGPGSS